MKYLEGHWYSCKDHRARKGLESFPAAMHRTKWLCTLAGGAVFGIATYFGDEKWHTYGSWTTNFIPSVKWDHNWDRRESSTLAKPVKHASSNEIVDSSGEKQSSSPVATRHMFLIRHGQYDVKGRNDSEHRLTELGKHQAELTGMRLKQLNFNYSVIVQSTMTRAQETATAIGKYLPGVSVNSSEMLCEGAPVPPEPPVGHFKPEMKFFEEGARIEAAFRKYFHRADSSQRSDSYEIFVCHANVIRYFLCRALQFPPEAWLRFSLHHCSITWLSIRPDGRVIVYAVGDSGHIPAAKLSR